MIILSFLTSWQKLSSKEWSLIKCNDFQGLWNVSNLVNNNNCFHIFYNTQDKSKQYKAGKSFVLFSPSFYAIMPDIVFWCLTDVFSQKAIFRVPKFVLFVLTGLFHQQIRKCFLCRLGLDASSSQLKLCLTQFMKQMSGVSLIIFAKYHQTL